jgi:hypothetical protein
VTTFYVLPYSTHSHGAVALADELDGKRIKLQNSNYAYQPAHVLINWGNGNCPYPQALNAKVCDVINKVDFFKKLVGCVSVPAFAFTKATAANLSFPVVCRTTVEGHDGQGIVVAENANQLVNASLYTSYVDKTSEYRVHVGRNPNGQVVIICRQKKWKTDAFTGDGRIWAGPETKLGFIETVPTPVANAVFDVFSKFPDLTFGAFDVAYNNSEERAYVLEINSAPMMTSETTARYAAFFRQFTTIPQETITMPPASTPTTAAPTPAPLSGNFNVTQFIAAQIAAGHITPQTMMAALTPETIAEAYVKTLIPA